jgi:hypothetical protein
MRWHADCYDPLESGMKINSGPGGYSNVVHMMDQMKLKKINQSIEIATEEQKIIARRLRDNTNMRSNSPGKGEKIDITV